MLTSDSKKCINLMEKLDIKLDKITDNIFDKQFIKVKKEWNEFDDKIISIKDKREDLLYESLSSPFISKTIKEEVIKMKGKGCTKFMCDGGGEGGKGITLYWYGTGWRKRVNPIMKRLIITKRIIADDHPGVVIVIAPTKLKKEIEWKEGNNIGVDHINSGSALIYHNQVSYIFLWREEELDKVAIHELIHALSGDRELYINSVMDCAVYNWLKIGKSSININETFTEVSANILHAFYIGCETGIEYKFYLQVERGFSLVQAAKLLKQLGYNSFKQLERSDLSSNKEFEQETNTVAYFILRAGVMYLFNQYTKMVSGWNSVWIFPPGDTEKKKFLDLIKKGCREMKIERLVEKVNHNMMRMTCLEMKR